MANACFVTGSMVLTFAFLAVGISFFAPYWLSNVPHAYSDELSFTGKGDYIKCDDGGPAETCVSSFPDRGLWAQCGLECQWFWENGYTIQLNLFTPLKWHLATQVLYFIGAAIILFCEIYARVQMCCSARAGVYISLSVTLFVSALIQVAAVATFGAGAARNPYYAISDPRLFTSYLGQASPQFILPYLGWTYWMAVVGAMLTVVSSIFFLLAGCSGKS